MTYVVIITPEAQANITAAHEYIAEHSPANAAEWLDSLQERIDGLKEFPRRYGKAREQFTGSRKSGNSSTNPIALFSQSTTSVKSFTSFT